MTMTMKEAARILADEIRGGLRPAASHVSKLPENSTGAEVCAAYHASDSTCCVVGLLYEKANGDSCRGNLSNWRELARANDEAHGKNDWSQVIAILDQVS